MRLNQRGRPVLRYHGGKWKLAPWILSFFPAHRVYVEPFGGGGSVLMRKARSYAEVYNDLDGEIVNVFRVLRDAATAAQLCQALALTPFARREFIESYEESADPVEGARRTIIRSLMGFGSAATNRDHATGFRSNSNRSGTTPARDWLNYPSNVATFTERLRGVVIEEVPAVSMIPRHDSPATLYYVDPPYLHSTRSFRRRNAAYRHEMGPDDHRALATVLRAVSGMVVVSGYPSELYDKELYPDWERRERKHLADGARARTEVVWLNPACAAALERDCDQSTLLPSGAA